MTGRSVSWFVVLAVAGGMAALVVTVDDAIEQAHLWSAFRKYCVAAGGAPIRGDARNNMLCIRASSLEPVRIESEVAKP